MSTKGGILNSSSRLMVHSDFMVLHQPMLVFCMATHIMRTNIHIAQSCCERLASADVDQCTAMEVWMHQ